MSNAASSDWDLVNAALGVFPTSVTMGSDEAALLQFADANPSPRPEAIRDGRGSYRLPEPGTGKTKSWTRATTLAKAISDEYALTLWKLEMAAVGFAQRPDLVAKVKHVLDTADRGRKGRVAGQAERGIISHCIDQASEEAGAGLRAKMGTALHTLTEHHDLGTGVVGPEPWASDVRAYAAELDRLGIVRPADDIEVIVLNEEVGTGGTLDRIVTLADDAPPWPAHLTPWERTDDGLIVPRIGDLKTGDELKYAHLEIAVQLAEYAYAEWRWNWATMTLIPMPRVDRKVGLVFHLPVPLPLPGEDRGVAECQVYEVDIVAGWELAQMCRDVRERRRRKDYFTPVRTDVVFEPAPTEDELTVPEPEVTVERGIAAVNALDIASFDPSDLAVLDAGLADVDPADDSVVLMVAELAMLAEADPQGVEDMLLRRIAETPAADPEAGVLHDLRAALAPWLHCPVCGKGSEVAGGECVECYAERQAEEAEAPGLVEQVLEATAELVEQGKAAVIAAATAWEANPPSLAHSTVTDEPFETAHEAQLRANCPDHWCAESGKCSAPFLCRSVGGPNLVKYPGGVAPLPTMGDMVVGGGTDYRPIEAARQAAGVSPGQPLLGAAALGLDDVDPVTGEVIGPVPGPPNPKPVSLIFCGSRTWVDTAAMQARLAAYVGDRGASNVEVISGGAGGADTMAHMLATKLGCHSTVMPADWDTHGKRAGYIRNEAMVNVLDARRSAGIDTGVEAFSHGSNGTQHTINLARSRYHWVHVTGVEAGAPISTATEGGRPADPAPTGSLPSVAAEPPIVAEPVAPSAPPSGPVDPSGPGIAGSGPESPAQPRPGPDATHRSQWVAGRITAIQQAPGAAAGIEAALRLWPPGVPGEGPWTDEQIDAMLPALEEGERLATAPFPDEDPSAPLPVMADIAADPGHAAKVEAMEAVARVETAPPWFPVIADDDLQPAAPALVADLKATMAEVGEATMSLVRVWRNDGRDHGRPWEEPTGPTVRSCALITLGMALARLDLIPQPKGRKGFDWPRAMLTQIVGQPLNPTWLTGAIVGSLSTDEANLASGLCLEALNDKSIRDDLVALIPTPITQHTEGNNP